MIKNLKNPRSLIACLIVLSTAATALPTLAQDDAKAKEKASSAVVNINTADADQLALLPRVGPAVAQRIVDYREENGKFESAEDLMLVRGIGEKTFALLEPYVTVSGETTLHDKVRVSQLSPDRGDR